MAKMNVLGTEISVVRINDDDYISLTDMVLNTENGEFFILNWLRNRNTIEFLGIWERVYNPNFNPVEFDRIKSQSGLNSYRISVKEWCEKTNAIGIQSRAGRYGGTFAHKDIAFEFGMWISAEFKIYLIKEFQRLKEQEYKQLGWDIRCNLTKLNYRIHTDAIKLNLIPKTITKEQASFKYAEEADILNVALFGITAAGWRKQNPELDGNIRDYADVAQLVCLANLESLNAHLINDGVPQERRIVALNQTAISQMKILTAEYGVKKLESKPKKNNGNIRKVNMKTCYYCGAKANNKEHLPPQQLFKGFRVDSLTVYSCEEHNNKKSFDDEAIIKSMLFALEKHGIVKNEDIKLSLDIVKPHHTQVKNKVSEKTLYKQNNIDYNFIVLNPDVNLNDWIKKLSAGLICYKTNFFDPDNRFDDSFVFKRNSYPNYETPKDLMFFKKEYERKMELISIIENGNWINGWNDKKNIYPVTIYAFYYYFIEKTIVIKHIFFQQFTFYNIINLSKKTLLKIK